MQFCASFSFHPFKFTHAHRIRRRTRCNICCLGHYYIQSIGNKKTKDLNSIYLKMCWWFWLFFPFGLDDTIPDKRLTIQMRIWSKYISWRVGCVWHRQLLEMTAFRMTKPIERKALNWVWNESTAAAVRLCLTRWAPACGNAAHCVSWLATCLYEFYLYPFEWVDVCVFKWNADGSVLVRWWRCEAPLEALASCNKIRWIRRNTRTSRVKPTTGDDVVAIRASCCALIHQRHNGRCLVI